MPRTSPRVSFGLFALEIKQDSIPSASNLQPFSKVSDLRTDNATYRPYATFEPDFWALDGQYKFLPSNLTTVHVGMMSLAMSDAGGAFAVPQPVLTVDFHQVHSSDGLALKFSQYTGDCASEIKIAFYNAAGGLIREDTYNPSSWEFSTGQPVSDYKKIVVTFLKTNRPYRYLRLTGIDYGELITFEGSSIKEASVIEETDLLSLEVIYNAFNLRLYSDDGEFSILNPTGYYAGLKERQPLAVHVNVDNQSVYIGTYYLDTWENLSDTDIKFRCVDLLGILDNIPCRGGIWLAGITLETLIEQLLGGISIPYDLDIELYGTVVKGWIPICSYREALQQIAFAVGAYVDCGRSGAVKIYKTKLASQNTSPAYTITKAEKGMGSTLSLRTLVTAVEVTAHNYLAGTETRELFNGSLAVGTHEIVFSESMHSLTITGATITESGVNYAKINVSSAGNVVLSGKEYVDTKQVYQVKNNSLGPTVKPNILQVKDATLVHSGNVAEITQRMYDYYQQRFVQKVKLYGASIEPGAIVAIDTLYGKQIRGVLEKSELDLAGGFVSQCEVIGVEHALD